MNYEIFTSKEIVTKFVIFLDEIWRCLPPSPLSEGRPFEPDPPGSAAAALKRQTGRQRE
jgi:hypothetical protein